MSELFMVLFFLSWKSDCEIFISSVSSVVMGNVSGSAGPEQIVSVEKLLNDLTET